MERPPRYYSDRQPTEIRRRRGGRLLALTFDDGAQFELSAEYLRVYSPSAEVKGHGPGQSVLQVGQEAVVIRTIEPVGHYAVRLVFDDEHRSGLYSWELLYDLGVNRETYWQAYLDALAEQGYQRRVMADKG